MLQNNPAETKSFIEFRTINIRPPFEMLEGNSTVRESQTLRLIRQKKLRVISRHPN